MKNVYMIMALLATLMVGCSDYVMSELSDEDDNDHNSDSSDNSTDEESEGSENIGLSDNLVPEDDSEGLDPDSDCGFHIDNGLLDEAFVLSYPSFDLVGDEVEVVLLGSPIELTYEVTAHECGDIELLVQQFVVEDVENFHWLSELIEEEAGLEDSEDEYVFEQTAANGAVLTSPSQELHYTWSDGHFPLGYDNTGFMDTVLIPAGESMELTFSFSATDNATPETIVDTWLTVAIWRDVGTEQSIVTYPTPYTKKTVQFVE